MIVLMAGLPGTGKSTLARAVASRLHGKVLSKDEIRHTLFAPADVEYSIAQDDFVMEIMLQTAGWIFRQDTRRIVLLDGRTFSRRYQIDRVLEVARALSRPWRILECVCPEDVARTRIAAQTESDDHPAGNRTVSLYLELKARFEPIRLPKTVIDTGRPLDECVNLALQALT
jgi:predicted kinase